MKTLIVALFFAIPGVSFAAIPILSYKHVSCRLYVEEEQVKEVSQPLMTLIIEDSIGRFAQIQFGDENLKIQYQLLFEDDLKVPGSVLVLQNLMVGSVESSAEFSAKDATWMRIRQGTHSVSCDVTDKVPEQKVQ
ncbi:hypothetical protein [Bdellovibrio bacteriovorus]|uniref:hypothetical protein n=1 Tax=Bdellovibrio bacteriovorus TaxID=959 RepID=UPI0035A5B1FE